MAVATHTKHSLLLGITEVPPTKQLTKVRSWLVKDTPEIMQVLAERMFFYDPLNTGGKDFSSRSQCKQHISALSPIRSTDGLFQTVLTDSDERRLRELSKRQGTKVNIRKLLPVGVCYSGCA